MIHLANRLIQYADYVSCFFRKVYSHSDNQQIWVLMIPETGVGGLWAGPSAWRVLDLPGPLTGAEGPYVGP